MTIGVIISTPAVSAIVIFHSLRLFKELNEELQDGIGLFIGYVDRHQTTPVNYSLAVYFVLSYIQSFKV